MSEQTRAVTIECPTDWLDQFGGTPESFARELRIAAAIEWYREGRVSQGRGAELAGLCREDFLDALFRAKVSASQVTAEEVREDVANVLAPHRGRLTADLPG